MECCQVACGAARLDANRRRGKHRHPTRSEIVFLRTLRPRTCLTPEDFPAPPYTFYWTPPCSRNLSAQWDIGGSEMGEGCPSVIILTGNFTRDLVCRLLLEKKITQTNIEIASSSAIGLALLYPFSTSHPRSPTLNALPVSSVCIFAIFPISHRSSSDLILKGYHSFVHRAYTDYLFLSAIHTLLHVSLTHACSTLHRSRMPQPRSRNSQTFVLNPWTMLIPSCVSTTPVSNPVNWQWVRRKLWIDSSGSID